MAISRTALIAAGTALHLLGTALAAHAQQLRVRPFVSGLSYPVAFLADPTSPTRHFVVEQQGHIRVVVDGVLQATDFLDLSSVVSTGSERGLLGMAIDPDTPTIGASTFITRARTIQGPP
jgi:glucose/arabinose dehydrogenase